MVRIAVAAAESVFRIPDFARIDVTQQKMLKQVQSTYKDALYVLLHNNEAELV